MQLKLLIAQQLYVIASFHLSLRGGRYAGYLKDGRPAWRKKTSRGNSRGIGK